MAQYRELECSKHGLTVHRRRSGRKNSWRCKECNSERALIHRRNTKLKCIEYLGNKCMICGYDKSPEAMDFHHKDPSEKEYAIDKMMTYSWDRIKPELDKCDLLCANCHRIIHSKSM